MKASKTDISQQIRVHSFPQISNAMNLWFAVNPLHASFQTSIHSITNDGVLVTYLAWTCVFKNSSGSTITTARERDVTPQTTGRTMVLILMNDPVNIKKYKRLLLQ